MGPKSLAEWNGRNLEAEPGDLCSRPGSAFLLGQGQLHRLSDSLAQHPTQSTPVVKDLDEQIIMYLSISFLILIIIITASQKMDQRAVCKGEIKHYIRIKMSNNEQEPAATTEKPAASLSSSVTSKSRICSSIFLDLFLHLNNKSFCLTAVSCPVTWLRNSTILHNYHGVGRLNKRILIRAVKF